MRSRGCAPRDANPVAYSGLYTAEQQRTAYPDIEPAMTSCRRKTLTGRRLNVMNKHKDLFCPILSRIAARERHRAARRPIEASRMFARSWAFAMMWWCACVRTPRARASMLALHPDTAARFRRQCRAHSQARSKISRT